MITLTAGTRLGPYEITSAIGAGGMGEYRARDTRLDRTVAIKVVHASLGADPSLRQRFEREARAISSLDPSEVMFRARRQTPRVLDQRNGRAGPEGVEHAVERVTSFSGFVDV